MSKIYSDVKCLSHDVADGILYLLKKTYVTIKGIAKKITLTITIKTPFIDFSFAPSILL